MTDIEQKALALLNDVRTERGFAPVEEVYGSVLLGEALCRAIEQIEQHEAFRQEVSDAVANWKDMSEFSSFETMLKLAEQDLFGFIIIAKPDPLEDVAKMMGYFNTAANAWAGDVRAALKACGLEIREKEQ